MTRPIGSESEFRRLREMTARTVRGPGPAQQQRPPAGQGEKARTMIRPADPRPAEKIGQRVAQSPASSARPDRRQPANAEDQARTTGDNDRLDEL